MIRIDRMPEVQYQAEFDQRSENLKEIITMMRDEHRDYPDMVPDFKDKLSLYQERLTGMTHFGLYNLKFPDAGQNAYANLLKKVIQASKDSRLKAIAVTMSSITGTYKDEEFPKEAEVSIRERRALLELNGKKVKIKSGDKKQVVKVMVLTDPLQFTPGKAWKTYKKYLPLLAAFTPYICGPTNDTFTQSRVGRMAQAILGIALSPLLLVGSALFLLIRGPDWLEKSQQVEKSIEPEEQLDLDLPREPSITTSEKSPPR